MTAVAADLNAPEHSVEITPTTVLHL